MGDFCHFNLQKNVHLFECHVKHASADHNTMDWPCLFQLNGIGVPKIDDNATLCRCTRVPLTCWQRKIAPEATESWRYPLEKQVQVVLHTKSFNQHLQCSKKDIIFPHSRKNEEKMVQNAIRCSKEKVPMKHKQHNQLEQLRPDIITSFSPV